MACCLQPPWWRCKRPDFPAILGSWGSLRGLLFWGECDIGMLSTTLVLRFSRSRPQHPAHLAPFPQLGAKFPAGLRVILRILRFKAAFQPIQRARMVQAPAHKPVSLAQKLSPEKISPRDVFHRG